VIKKNILGEVLNNAKSLPECESTEGRETIDKDIQEEDGVYESNIKRERSKMDRNILQESTEIVAAQ